MSDLVDATTLGDDDRRALRELYEDAFPAGLRSDFASLLDDEVLAYVAQGQVLGLVVLRRLTDPGWVFVRYYAAAERGSGVGSRMWAQLRQHLGDGTRVVLDMEHPDEAGLERDEAEVRRRRARFYERLGVHVLPVRDYAPPQAGSDAPLLLAAEVGPDADADLVAHLVVLVHQDRYGIAPSDPRVRRTLQASGLVP